jgi:hypothetical protein
MPHGANLSNSAATLPGGNPMGQGGAGLPARARHPVWQDRHHWRGPPSLLVAAVPVALLAGVVMMMLGYVVGGLALSGGSVLAAAIAVALAGMSGMRHLRKLVSGRSFRVVQLDGSQYTDVAEPQGGDYANVVQLDRSEYTQVR